MKTIKINLHILAFLVLSLTSYSQTYPVFGNEIPVTINNLTLDAMEPFISTDGNILFFNSLNSVDTTNLYYALKVNDSTFNFIGLVNGTYDTSAVHLDAVASMDSLNNFFWTTLRDFPSQVETIQKGNFSLGTVNNITKIYGTCNINSPGWLIFDAAINFQGSILYYTNAFFNNCTFGAPCIAQFGAALKVNDSTYDKITNSDLLFSNVNDTNYIVYAPQVTKDGLELYYTRLLKNSTNTEICVAVRTAITDIFSLPSVIHSSLGSTPEAATPTTDKQKIYYHQRNSSGVFKIYMRNRTGTVGIIEKDKNVRFLISPNPFSEQTTLKTDILLHNATLTIYNSFCRKIKQMINISGQTFSIFRDGLPSGLYFVRITEKNKFLAGGKMLVIDK